MATDFAPQARTAMTLLYRDPLFLKHDTGRGHPETADRLRSIFARLDKAGLPQRCTAGTQLQEFATLQHTLLLAFAF